MRIEHNDISFSRCYSNENPIEWSILIAETPELKPAAFSIGKDGRQNT